MTQTDSYTTGPDNPIRLLLRAEITASDWHVVGHTLEVSASSLFVQTHETAYIGDRLGVKLSFPGLLAPLHVTGHVVSQMLPSEPGEPRGLTLALTFETHRDEQTLRHLLERVGARRLRGPGSARPYRLLVVDDSRLVQQMFQYRVTRFFEDRAHKLELAFSATVDDAWDKVQSGDYNLAIVDYFLPELLGSELIRRMRADRRSESIPIIAISTGGEAAREASLHAGADLFLDKPLVFRDLFTTIGQLIPQRLPA